MPSAAAETARKMAVLYDLFCRKSRTRKDRIYYGRRYRYWSARAIILERRPIMDSTVIEVICNGDFPGRDIARKYLTLEDMEYLYQQKEKAAVGAATSSET